MKTVIVILLLTTNAIGQGAVGADKSETPLPEGMAGGADIETVQLLRIEALKELLQIFEDQISSGTHAVGQLLDLYHETQVDLALAQLETTDDKQERLDHIQTAVDSAIQIWKFAKDRSRIGIEGSGPEAEARARAQVYELRAMWLKEKATHEITQAAPRSLETLRDEVVWQTSPPSVPCSCSATTYSSSFSSRTFGVVRQRIMRYPR